MSIYNILLTAMIFAVCAFLCGGVYCFLLILLKIVKQDYKSNKVCRLARSTDTRWLCADLQQHFPVCFKAAANERIQAADNGGKS